MELNPEELARAALQGFFGDEEGFKRMDSPLRKRAVKSIAAYLKKKADGKK